VVVAAGILVVQTQLVGLVVVAQGVVLVLLVLQTRAAAAVLVQRLQIGLVSLAVQA
jgi:hypothetical protein